MRVMAYFQGADTVWHEQIVCCAVDDEVWVICSSDGDVYAQNLVSGEDCSHLVVLPSSGRRPSGMGARIYGFKTGLESHELVKVIRQGLSVAASTPAVHGARAEPPSHLVL